MSNTNPTERPQRAAGTFSIKAILVFMTVFAAGAASLAHLVRASISGEPNDIGIFVLTTTITPMAVMVAVSWFFWIARKLSS